MVNDTPWIATVAPMKSRTLVNDTHSRRKTHCIHDLQVSLRSRLLRPVLASLSLGLSLSARVGRAETDASSFWV